MDRRDFLKKSAIALGAIAIAKNACAQDIHKNHTIPSDKDMHMMMHAPVGWADPNIKISPPARMELFKSKKRLFEAMLEQKYHELELEKAMMRMMMQDDTEPAEPSKGEPKQDAPQRPQEHKH